MLINLRNALMAGKRLPFDAEVEFLESTGTQWINTGVVSSGIDVKCLMAFTDNTVANQGVFGSRVKSGDTGSNAYQIWYNISSNNLRLDWASYAKSATVSLNTPVRIEAYQNGSVFVNGTEYTGNAKTANAYNFYIFNFNQGGALGATGCRAKVYSFQIWQNGALVRDYIPVRKGTVGYLYDRVSGKLFGNAGTGDFVLGPDVVPVEYIESTGTQWIDTGYAPKANSGVRVSFRVANVGFNDGIFGARTSGGNDRFWIVPSSAGMNFGFGGPFSLSAISANTDYTASLNFMSDGKAICGANSTNISGFSGCPYPLYIFAANVSGTASFMEYSKRIYGLTITEGGEVVADFIPVRKGTVGYLYDRVSGKLFGNDGSGDFVLGPDKN